LGDRTRLVERLDRTRPADHDDSVAADVHAAYRHHRIVRLRLAADELVSVRDRNDLFHAGEVLEDQRIRFTAVPGNADGRTECAWNRVCPEAHSLDVANYGFDL